MKRTFYFAAALLLGAIVPVGCVKNRPASERPLFESEPLEACLAVNIDLSGSFASDLETRAYPLVRDLMDRFFAGSLGENCKIVLSQLSGHDDVVLFEGSPEELQRRFKTPEEMAAFLKSKSKPNHSPIYRGVRTTIAYVNAMPDVTNETRMLTVVITDGKDSEPDAKRRHAEGMQMVETLKTYQKAGGGLALYYIDPGETARWRRIVNDMAGFTDGQCVINNNLVASPQLPEYE